jgi:hypothetical protein
LKKGLRATTLRYPYEVRNEKPYFEDIPDVKVQGEMLKLAEHMLESKQGDFDPTEFEDRYEDALTLASLILELVQVGLFAGPRAEECFAVARRVLGNGRMAASTHFLIAASRAFRCARSRCCCHCPRSTRRNNNIFRPVRGSTGRESAAGRGRTRSVWVCRSYASERTSEGAA